MPFRFRKSIKIIPGVRLNLSSKGVSASAGIPGTGLSYHQKLTGTGRRGNASANPTVYASAAPVRTTRLNKWAVVIIAFLIGFIGGHRFYLGQWGKGILCFVFCWTLIPAFIALFDCFYFGLMSDDRFNDLYNAGLVDPETEAEQASQAPTYNVADITRPKLVYDEKDFDLIMVLSQYQKQTEAYVQKMSQADPTINWMEVDAVIDSKRKTVLFEPKNEKVQDQLARAKAVLDSQG